MGKDGHLSQVRQGLALPQTGAEKRRASTGIDQQAGLHFPALTVWPVHLERHLVRSDTGALHQVLTMDRRPHVRCMLEQEIIEGGTYDIISEHRLKRGGLKGKGVAPTPLILVIESGPWFRYEAGLTQGVVTSQAIKERQVRRQQRLADMKPWESLALKNGDAQAPTRQQRGDCRPRRPPTDNSHVI